MTTAAGSNPHLDYPSAPTSPASDGPARGLPRNTLVEPLRLTVQHPSAGICVVTVDGELDTLTSPLLEACVRELLAAVPKHLILDLAPVRFLGSAGLACLLQLRELAQQTASSRLLLAGLATRVVARSLGITGLLGQFDSYPTLSQALSALPG